MLSNELRDTLAVLDNNGNPGLILIAREIENLDAAGHTTDLVRYIAEHQSVLDAYGPGSLAFEAMHGIQKPAPVTMVPHMLGVDVVTEAGWPDGNGLYGSLKALDHA